MPGSGLPKILELTIENILEKGNFASYKIAGNGPRTAIVLRYKTTRHAAGEKQKLIKIIIDTYEYTIFTETEDFIVESCVRGRATIRKESPKTILQDPKATSKRREAPHCLFLNHQTVYGMDADDIRRF